MLNRLWEKLELEGDTIDDEICQDRKEFYKGMVSYYDKSIIMSSECQGKQ